MMTKDGGPVTPAPIPLPDVSSAIEAAKAAIVPMLASHGFGSVVIAYDGYGDEGQIEAIAAFDGVGGERPLPEVACPRHDSRFGGGVTETPAVLTEALETLGYEVLATCFCGWETNEGAVGSMTLDVTTSVITITHDWRVTALERDERIV